MPPITHNVTGHIYDEYEAPLATIKLAGLRMLSGQVQSNLKDSMLKGAFSFYKPEFKDAMVSLQKTISEQNDKLSEIYAKAATLGLDLASEAIVKIGDE